MRAKATEDSAKLESIRLKEILAKRTELEEAFANVSQSLRRAAAVNDEFHTLLQDSLATTLNEDGIKKDDGVKKRKRREKKDPNLPKRPMASYIHFSNHHRMQMKEEHPDTQQKEIAKLLGEKWKSLDAEERKPWEEIAAQDKERYNKEMATFTANANVSHEENDISSSEDESAPPKKTPATAKPPATPSTAAKQTAKKPVTPSKPATPSSSSASDTGKSESDSDEPAKQPPKKMTKGAPAPKKAEANGTASPAAKGKDAKVEPGKKKETAKEKKANETKTAAAKTNATPKKDLKKKVKGKE